MSVTVHSCNVLAAIVSLLGQAVSVVPVHQSCAESGQLIVFYHHLRAQTNFCHCSLETVHCHSLTQKYLYVCACTDIIRMIKSRRMRWAGYVTHMEEIRNVYTILV
jgi:hypothetical protein